MIVRKCVQAMLMLMLVIPLNLHTNYAEADADFVSKLCPCAVIPLC